MHNLHAAVFLSFAQFLQDYIQGLYIHHKLILFILGVGEMHFSQQIKLQMKEMS